MKSTTTFCWIVSNFLELRLLYRVDQKNQTIFEVHNFLYTDIGRHSIYENVQLFITSKNDILNATVFKYSLHKVRETTLH